ncbi:MAG TPA: hypothetical protein VJ715_06800, partial [Pyrinomonadaceae bacterium]|nr:hypothetical protein [Pyrinomonadaceae bacterium]
GPGPPQDLQEQLAAERQRGTTLTEELRREQERHVKIVQELEAAREQVRRASVPGTETPRSGGATVRSFILTVGAVRGSGETNTIRLSPGVRVIQLRLDLAAQEYQSYRAVLKSIEGQKELLSRKMLRARNSRGRITVSMNLPAQLLSRGDYQIELGGETPAGEYEEVDTYYFRVAR